MQQILILVVQEVLVNQIVLLLVRFITLVEAAAVQKDGVQELVVQAVMAVVQRAVIMTEQMGVEGEVVER